MHETMPGAPPHEDMSDAALLGRYLSGAPQAAALLAQRHLPRLLALATRMLGDRSEAEDVAQEVMMRLWRHAPKWQAEGAALSTWLYKVTSNLCIDRLRRRAREAPTLETIPEPVDPAPGGDARLQNAARSAALEAALMSLPARQRQAVVLRHIEGLSNPQIAQIMGVGIEAVESLTARGRRALATRLMGQRAALGYRDED